MKLFLQGDVPAESRTRLVDYLREARDAAQPIYWTAEDVENHRLRTVTHLTLTLPEFQLN